MAQNLGAAVVQHPFVNQARQFQWALDHCAIDTKWVMCLDADEYPEPELVTEISDRLPLLPDDVAGIQLKRRPIFMGRWIRHGTRYPLILLRIWRTGKGRIEQRWMNEHIVVKGGKVSLLSMISVMTIGAISVGGQKNTTNMPPVRHWRF